MLCKQWAIVLSPHQNFFSLGGTLPQMCWYSNSVPFIAPPPFNPNTFFPSSLLPFVALLHLSPPLHPCSSCRAAPGYSLKSSAHPVHPSPPWSPLPGCWAPSRSCAPTSLPFLWSPSRLPLTPKVCALSSCIAKEISILHSRSTWPQCEAWVFTRVRAPDCRWWDVRERMRH